MHTRHYEKESSCRKLSHQCILAHHPSAQAANSRPKPNDAFVELDDFVFDDGGNLASLKLHYLTLGTPRRDASGAIANGVLLLHGTAGSAADLAQAAFFDALYGAGEPLDLNRYFLVIPDAIGAGDSSKPSDGLRANFPHYGPCAVSQS